MASAVGNSARGDRGSRCVDIRDYGARPNAGQAAASVNRAAIQAAADALGTTLGGSGLSGTLYIPAGDWYIDRPIYLEWDAMTICGEGMDASRILTTQHDALVIGVQRAPNGVALTPAHLVDLYTGGAGGAPLLDSSAVSAAGQRWGLRTMTDCRISQHGGGIDQPCGDGTRLDGYAGVRKLTVELAVDFTNAPGTGSFPTYAPLAGMGDGTPKPWNLKVYSSKYQFSFRTASSGIDQGVVRTITFGSVRNGLGLVRVTVQVDLDAAGIAVWIDGVQVIWSWSAGQAGFVPGLSFAANQDTPLGLGGLSDTALGSGSGGGLVDLTFCGFHVLKAAVYSDQGPGMPQARIDGAAINDLRRYFLVSNGKSLGCIPLQDPPASVTTDRVVSVISASGPYGNQATTTAYFLDNVNHGKWISTRNLVLHDLTVRSASALWGKTVCLGNVNGLTIERCRLFGGGHAIASLAIGGSYQCQITDCECSGRESPIYLYLSSSFYFRNIFLGGGLLYDRCGIRLVESAAYLENVFTPTWGAPEYLLKAERSWASLDTLASDNESAGQGPQIAAFYASASTQQPIKSQLLLRNINIAGMGPNASMVILESNQAEGSPTGGYCQFELQGGVPMDWPMRSFVRVGASNWEGQFNVDASLERPYYVENLAGAPCRVTAVDRRRDGPPRDGRFDRGSCVIRPADPAVGQFTEWRCTAPGIYGTAAPPTWLGVAPIDDGYGLAAYVHDAGYWAASGAPAGAAGAWSNGALSLGLNALLAGGTLPAPPTIYAGLVRWQARRKILAGDLTYYSNTFHDGYARVAVPSSSWSASSGGAASNTQAITFPTATATWFDGTTPYLCLAFYAAASGNSLLAAADIAPNAITAGMAPSFPAGSIRLGKSARSAQGSFSDAVLDALNNYWLKGTALTPPSVYLALSTAPADPTVPPTEPVGGAYARVATTPSSWAGDPDAALAEFGAPATAGIVRNAAKLSFPAPTGNWGTARSVYLMDAATGGNVLAAANLAIPRTILAGEPARSFAPGALWICRS